MSFAERLDPEIAAIIDLLPRFDLTDIPSARAQRAALAQTTLATAVRRDDVIAEDRVVGDHGARMRLYRRRAATPDLPAPALVWVHGGGHVLGAIDQDDPLMETVAATMGCVCLSVDWRQAPEHPYPAALDDAWAVLRHAFNEAAALGIDPRRIAIGGASSGGGVAAALALRARDAGGPQPCFQWLVYPMLDDRGITKSSRTITDSRIWNDDCNRRGWAAYLGELSGGDAVPAYAAPARATDLSGLPPAFIGTGDLDLFVDENIAYAQALLDGDVPVELHVYPGAVHGFDLFAPDATVSRRFRADRDGALARALNA
ncbi:alpha/beta hydrolase [Sphingomonas sp. 1P06PA]|uniref:alpha/beta hydrolase n=1 Tax=Sphingomonas sp. 1P06PA TaxID=554121 RepID=UPI0039A6033C